MENNPTTPNPAPKSSSGLAIAGLVLGIIAAVTSFLPIINNLSAIIAFIGAILAVIALIGALRGKHTAKGLYIAGVVLCVVSFIIVLVTQSMYSAALKSAADSLKTGSSPVSATSNDSASTSDAAAPSATSSNADSTSAAPSSSSSSEPAIEVDYSNMAIGQTVTLENGLSITVNSVDRTATKYDGSPLLKASVTYANNGSSSASFNTFDWKCVDANGVETGTYFSMNDGTLSSGKLTAGGNVTGDIYFEGSPVKILYYSNFFQDESSIAWVVS